MQGQEMDGKHMMLSQVKVISYLQDFPGFKVEGNPPANAVRYDPVKETLRMKWQLTAVFCAWKIPMIEEPGELQSLGLEKSSQISD